MSPAEEQYTKKMLSRRANVVAYGYHKDQGSGGYGRSAIERSLILKARKRNIPLDLVFPPAGQKQQQQPEHADDEGEDDVIRFRSASGDVIEWRPERAIAPHDKRQTKDDKRRTTKKKRRQRSKKKRRRSDRSQK